MTAKAKSLTNMQSRPRLRALAIYSLLWLLCALVMLAIFRWNDKSFLWIGDGVYQHFSSFQYICDYLKELIYDHRLAGTFDFTLGQGMDAITTLNSYDMMDPISILCALVFPLSRAARYTLMIFIKLYLVGFAFLFYCFSIGKEEKFSVSAGAIAYTFSSAILFMAARHPNYINWAYFLPFLLGSVELFIRKKKRAPLIIFVFLNLLTSFYTFYINAILVVIYVLIHVICKVAQERKLAVLGEQLKNCLKILGLACVGAMLAAFSLFPTIYAYLNNARFLESSGYTASLWHYPLEYYLQTFEDIFAPYRTYGFTTLIGLNVVMMVPLILVFIRRKQNLAIKWLLVISCLMLCVPLVGRIMNGFGYASNRWAFAIPFYISVVFVTLFSDLKEMSGREKLCVGLVTAAYIGLCFLHVGTNADELKVATLIVLAVAVAAMLIVLHLKLSAYKPVVLTLVTAGACFQIYNTFAPSKGNYISRFIAPFEVEESYRISSSAAADMGDGFYRVEAEESLVNVNGRNDVYGTGFRWSMVPSYVMDYYDDLALSSVINNCGAENLGGRTGLMALAGVKYYTRPAQDGGYVPYGYEETESPEEMYQIYENSYALPIGYTYFGYVPASQYEEMNGIEKELAMLQGVVLDDTTEIDGLEPAGLNLDYDVLDYEITGTDNAQVSGNVIDVFDRSGTITITADIPADSEIYLYFKGIELTGDTEYLTFNVERENDDYSFKRSAHAAGEDYSWPPDRDDICFDMGCGAEGENMIVLSFDSAAVLSYEDLQIIAVPISSYVDNVEKLGENVLEDISVENDRISGTISLPASGILQVAVPFSDGWTARVDGEEVDILQSDVMYMAIPLDAGEHSVEFSYHTPYLRLGLVISGSTLILWLLFELIYRNRRKKNALPSQAGDIFTENSEEQA